MYVRKPTGFTLIELMLAMTFLSILLIAIVTVTIQVGKLYDKGQTLKSVNQAGRDLSDSLRRDALAAGSIQNNYVAPTAESGELGRICLGSVSYVWNTARNLEKNDPNKLVKYKDTQEVIVMARVSDMGGNYCQTNNAPSGVKYKMDIPKDGATEVLKSAKRDLAVHDMKIAKLVEVGTNKLYAIDFVLGTNESGTIDTVDNSCKPPAAPSNLSDEEKKNYAANFDFCAVNKFQLLVSVG